MDSGACCTPGSQQEMLVPEPGRDSTVNQTPAICARSRLAANRRWPGTNPPWWLKKRVRTEFARPRSRTGTHRWRRRSASLPDSLGQHASVCSATQALLRNCSAAVSSARV